MTYIYPALHTCMTLWFILYSKTCKVSQKYELFKMITVSAAVIRLTKFCTIFMHVYIKNDLPGRAREIVGFAGSGPIFES